MAYDRQDPRRGPRAPHDSSREREQRGREERGFFERAGDEIASWFGDDDGDRQRDPRTSGRESAEGRQYRRETEPSRGSGQWRSDYDRGDDRGGRSPREQQSWRGGHGDEASRYRPLAGDYGRSEDAHGAGGFGRGGDERPDRYERAGDWGRDDARRARGAAPQHPQQDRQHDPHYQEWRQRQIEALDRDYEEYRREHQSKFENDFGSWRSNRQTRRQMLGQVRDQMTVVGNDQEPIGTVDRVAGDRVILAKSDPESGGSHHSLSCAEIERIDGDRVILSTTAAEARTRWRDENRERALFEREDQGEAGPHMLDRSFSGTYR